MLRQHAHFSALRLSRLRRPSRTFDHFLSSSNSPSIAEPQNAPQSQPASPSPPPPLLPLSASVRSCMRLSPNPLTIILSSSSRHRSSSSDNHSSTTTTTGLLVSSFNSITLSPTPFISFNIKLPSTTYSAILSSGYFSASGINSQELAQVMLEPASPKKHRRLRYYVEDDKVGEGGRGILGGLRGIGGIGGGARAPLLKDESGVGGVWWMQCEWIREMSVQVGDHMIIVGEVLAAGKYRRRNERKGLVYLNGNYKLCGNSQGVRMDRFGARNKEDVVLLQERVELFGERLRELATLHKKAYNKQKMGSDRVKMR